MKNETTRIDFLGEDFCAVADVVAQARSLSSVTTGKLSSKAMNYAFDEI